MAGDPPAAVVVEQSRAPPPISGILAGPQLHPLLTHGRRKERLGSGFAARSSTNRRWSTGCCRRISRHSKPPGERLAFERSGTRLYEAILVKFDSEGSWDGGPTGSELRDFYNEERAHFLMLKETIESLGGDPSTITPSADVSGVASEGVVKVVTDPRTSLTESLEALLVAELTDHDGWEMLIHLADGIGEDKLASKFRGALAEEDTHLAKVREWLTKGIELESGSG